MNTRGVTLWEIMAIVFIMAVMAAIAVPNFVNARRKSEATFCVHNLRVLDQAKQQWAREKQQRAGAMCTWTDINPYLPNPIGPQSCPAGGRYRLGDVGEAPVCDIGGDHKA